MMFTIPANGVLVAGRSLDLVAQAVREAQCWRARNGLPPLAAYGKLLGALAAPDAAALPPVAPVGHTDVRTPAALHAEGMTTEQAADMLGKSTRQVRRLAPQLGGRKVGRAYLLDRAAVLEFAEGCRP